MTLPLDEYSDYQSLRGRKVWKRVHLKPFLDEARFQQNNRMVNSQMNKTICHFCQADGFDESLTSENLETTEKLSCPSDFSTEGSLSIDKRATEPVSAMLDFYTKNKNSISDMETLIIPIASNDLGNMDAKGYLSHLRALVKSLGVYSLSSLASPLVSLILAPFLTRNLSHNDYGALAVLNTALYLLTGLTQLGLSTAFFRAYSYDYESQRDKFGILSTSVNLLLLASIPVAIGIIIAAPWLTFLLFNDSALSGPMMLVGVVAVLQNLTVPGFAWLRAESRPLFFSLLSITNLLVSLVANFALVGALHMGIAGSIIATGMSYAVVVLFTVPIILFRAGLRFRLDIAKGLLSFGVPSVFTFISVWILQLSDRFLLVRLGSLAQTASYSLAYSLGGALSIVVLSPFTLAWPSAMFTIAKRDDAVYIFRQVFRWYGVILLFCAFGLSLVSIAVLNLFFPPPYHSASPIIPIITASIMFYGIYVIFMTGTSIKKKTWYAVGFTTSAALTNVVLNIILIPIYGSMGAAISTLVAYVLLAILGYIVNQRIYPVPYEIGNFILGLSLGVALYICSSLLAQGQELYKIFIFYLCTLFVYGGCIAFVVGKLPIRRRRTKP